MRAQFCGAGGSGYSDSAAVGRPSSKKRTTPPVDLVHLAKQTAGDTALEQDVLSLFVSQSAIYLDRIRTASRGDDRTMAAHALRGSALAIGAWDVARLSKRIEVQNGAPPNSAWLADLEISVRETLTYIEALSRT